MQDIRPGHRGLVLEGSNTISGTPMGSKGISKIGTAAAATPSTTRPGRASATCPLPRQTGDLNGRPR
jgi:hypothetical protein